MTELDCYRIGCQGDFEDHVGSNSDHAFKCDECGTTLNEDELREMSQGNDSIADLATVLLNDG